MSVEAVYWRYHGVYSEPTDTVEEAVAFLAFGADWGNLHGVGVFVDGEPVLTDTYVTEGGWAPTDEEQDQMREAYARVVREDTA